MLTLREWVVLATLVTGTVAAAQPLADEAQPPLPRNVVTLDTAGVFNGVVSVNGERVLTDWLSVRLGLELSFNSLQLQREQSRISGEGFTPYSVELGSRSFSAALEPGVRFYLSGRAPEGLWTGLQLGVGAGRALTRSSTNDTGVQINLRQESNQLLLSGEALVGYSLLLAGNFTLQGAVGLAGLHVSSTESPTHLGAEGEPLPNQPPARSQSWGVTPAVRLAFGWAF